MNTTSKKYWFPAKRYGWGWGLPQTWQGWLVLLFYVSGVAAVAVAFPPRDKTLIFAVSVLILTMLFVLIAWFKGEPPRWRWGKEDLP
jgi:uncharacterized membrane protein YhaH (DUF805 family)